MADGGGFGDFEMSFVDEDCIVYDGDGFRLLEQFVWIQSGRAEFKSRQITRADQYRAVDCGWSIIICSHPGCVQGWKRLAGDSVVVEVHHTLGEIDEPAIFDSMLIDVSLDGFELLSPVGVGVSQVFISLGGSAPKFVRISHVSGIGACSGN